MDDFREQFLSDASAKLDKLIAEIEISEVLSPPLKSEVLRTLHTIKGSAQTFGIDLPAALAHQLESLVSKHVEFTVLKAKLLSGFANLQNALMVIDSPSGEDFLNELKISDDSSDHSKSCESNQSLMIPTTITSKLSQQEKTTLETNFSQGKSTYCVEIGFETAAFSPDLLKARNAFNEIGNVIATIPAIGFGQKGNFGFQFLFSTSEDSEAVSNIVQNFAGKITFSSNESLQSLRSVAETAISHGQEIATSLGKSITFEVKNDDVEVSETVQKVIFDALLHLVRNAVDHGIDEKGTIRLMFMPSDYKVSVIISDDGNGIDLAEIKRLAMKTLPREQVENFSDQATLELIFKSEFSTAAQITEISGRGVGLDAVKTAVENAGGSISVKSELNKGTTFEILLPKS